MQWMSCPRRVVRHLVVACCLAVASISAADAGSAVAQPLSSAAGDAAYVDRLLFDVPLDRFVVTTQQAADRRFDWTTDWCSAPLVGTTGRSFDFHGPCRRHDFGYRNLPLLERRWGAGSTYWNHTSRLRVDRQFLSDMLGHCARRSWVLRPTCRAWAYTFYAAVRAFGGP